MNISIISFTCNGYKLSGEVQDILQVEGHCVKRYVKSKYLKSSDGIRVEGPLGVWVKNVFESEDGVIFIGASGIAVRAIAPYVQDKRYDPAVLILDERGAFCIPLLGGHLGGANELATMISEPLGAHAVITTATDVNGRFAVDVFAKKNGLLIGDMKLAKEVSAKLLHEEMVGIFSELSIVGELPEGLTDLKGHNDADIGDLGIYIGVHKGRSPFKRTLYLIPNQVVLGLGCRKGICKRVIGEVIAEVISEKRIFPEAIQRICSIDLKKEELGIIQYCKEMGTTFLTFTADELSKVPGAFTGSDFVSKVTGVDNVCERSARLGSGLGRLIQNKTAKNGVTVALAIADRSVQFE